MEHSLDMASVGSVALNKNLIQGYVEAYLSARGDKALPYFEDCLTGAMLPYLKDVSVLEVQGDGNAHVRFAGTNIFNRMDVEVTGKNLLDFFAEGTQEATYADLVSAILTPCGIYASYDSLYPEGKRAKVEILALIATSEDKPDSRFVITQFIFDPVEVQYARMGEQRVGFDALRVAYVDLGFGVPADLQSAQLKFQVPENDSKIQSPSLMQLMQAKRRA